MSISAVELMLDPTTFKMRPLSDLSAEQNGLAGLGERADDVRSADRVGHGRAGFDLYLMAGTLGAGKLSRLGRVACPQPNAAQRSHRHHGIEMTARLFAGAEQREIPRVGPRQKASGEAAGGRGADRGDLCGIEQCNRLAVLRLEQQHQA